MKKLLFILAFVPTLLFAQTKEELIATVKANPKDVQTLQTLQRIGVYDPDYKELQGLFKKLDKKVRKSNSGKLFERYLDALKNTQVGKKAPSITQLDLSGEPYALSDLKGKYVLVDFWASWCPPCREENPRLVKTYAEFKDKNFEILGVSFDKEFANWDKAIKDDKLTWKHVSDLQGWNNSAGQTYGVKAIPQNILIDPNGIIIAKNLHGDALNAKLREVLK
ncbi:TlpA family protein disulfide reductase [Sphingobacterium hotanense]|uniref:TlpA family protein disulfide reductase n=1 Tax=Sphingobacterium hotanense TaxID=649196 RepID=A0ABT7NSN9_9SPHI|nr:TlpA disulfide reductase family protein [Sphingobacterium hotanense]MDM1050222.1 TlpA family protein disulfide reductase [Sphingobacterium hotanense]